MEVWLIILMVAILLIVIILTLNNYKKGERKAKNSEIIRQYWQAIVLASFGVILLIVFLLKSFDFY